MTEEEKNGLKEGGRLHVTVLFSDMQDFTPLSQSLDPEEMDSLMNEIFTGFEGIITRYEGSVEKYIGDALVAVFGAREVHEDDPARAVHAALDFYTLVESITKKSGRTIQFRTGIHLGLVTTGKRGIYDVVTGHVMNVAARLQTAAAKGSILVSAAIKAECGGEFLFSEEQRYELKGLREDLATYTVIGKNRMPLTFSTPFVGRKGVVSEILKCYLKHDSAKVEGYYLYGETGIGKTRVAAEFIRKVEQFPDYNLPLLYARARKYRRLPFSVINDLLLNYFGILSPVNSDIVCDTICQQSDLEEATVRSFAQFVTGENEERPASRIFVDLYLILSQIIHQQSESPYSMILYIDDAFGMDPMSRDFFRFFLKSTEIKPFFILAERKVRKAIEEIFQGVELFQVPSLSRPESRELIKVLWPENRNESLEESLIQKTSGNPLFLEEYVRYARESGGTVKLPTSIQNIYLSILEGYTREMRDLLVKLAIFHRHFTLEDAEDIHGKSGGHPDMVQAALSYFLREEILTRDNEVYSFLNDHFKWALYNSILNYNKKILHRLVARQLMKRDCVNVFRLLHHLTKAEDYTEAERVIVEDLSHFNDLDFLKYLDILIEALPAEAEEKRFNYLYRKIALLYNNGRKEDAYDFLKEALRIALKTKKPEYSARVNHLLSAFHLTSYSFPKAALFGKKAVAYYKMVDPEHQAIQNVYKLIATSELLGNRIEKNEQILSGMKEGGEKWAAQAERYFFLGQYHDSVAVMKRLMEDTRKIIHGRWWKSGFILLPKTYWLLCDYTTLKEISYEAIKWGNQSAPALSVLYAFLAQGCHFTGSEEEVDDYLKQSEFYLYKIQNNFDRIDAIKVLSIVLFLLNRIDEAVKHGMVGIEIGIRDSSYYSLFSLYMLMTEISYLRESFDDARYYLTEGKFLMELKTLLSTRDQALYHHFYGLLLAEDDEERQYYRKKATRILNEERANLEDEKLIENFLALRSYMEIAKG